MPLEEDPMKQTAFPFGVGVQTPRRPNVNTATGALREAYASGAAKPAQAAEGIPRTLPDVLSMMQ